MSTVKSTKKKNHPTSSDVLKVNKPPPIKNDISINHTTVISTPQPTNQSYCNPVEVDSPKLSTQNSVVVRKAPPPPVSVKDEMIYENMNHADDNTIKSPLKPVENRKSKTKIIHPKVSPPAPPASSKPSKLQPNVTNDDDNKIFPVVLKPVKKNTNTSENKSSGFSSSNSKETTKIDNKPSLPQNKKPGPIKPLLPPTSKPTTVKPSVPDASSKPSVPNKPPRIVLEISDNSKPTKVAPEVLPKPRKAPKSPRLPPLRVDLKVPKRNENSCATPDTALTDIETPDTAVSVSARKAQLEGKFLGLNSSLSRR